MKLYRFTARSVGDAHGVYIIVDIRLHYAYFEALFKAVDERHEYGSLTRTRRGHYVYKKRTPRREFFTELFRFIIIVLENALL